MLSANDIEDIKAQAFMGCPSELKGVCKVYPKTMKEIISIGVTKYNGMLGLLLLTETEIVDLIKEKTGKKIPVEEIEPLSYLMISAD